MKKLMSALCFIAIGALAAESTTTSSNAKAAVNTSKSNTYKVTAVDAKAKTFTAVVNGQTVTLDAAKMKAMPRVGDVLKAGGDDPAKQRTVCAVVECDMGWGSGPCIKCFDYKTLRGGYGTPTSMKGRVVKVDKAANTFTLHTDHGDVTFDAKALKAVLEVGKVYDITYTTKPGGGLQAQVSTLANQ